MTKANEGSDSLNVEPIEQPYGSGTTWVTGEIDKEQRKWAMFCHLAGLAGFSPLLPAGRMLLRTRWPYLSPGWTVKPLKGPEKNGTYKML